MNVYTFMRHAKSAYPVGVPDHDRPLSDRGRRNALAARTWLLKHNIAIDLALISTALRTRQTWEILDPDHVWPVLFEPDLYLASAQTVDIIARQHQVSNSLILGHNPGIHEAAEVAAQVPIERFPTSAIAIVDETGLRDFIIPR